MKETPSLRSTKNYDMFELDPLNRKVHEDKELLASMRRDGFRPSGAIHCTSRRPSGKYRVVEGANRLHFAKMLGLPVYFIVDDSNTDIATIEGTGRKRERWTFREVVESYAKAGHPDYRQLKAFRDKHGLTEKAALALLAGESAGSHNRVDSARLGQFRVSADPGHARAVGELVDYFRNIGIDFACRGAFVSALSMCLRVPEVRPEIFKRRAKVTSTLMRKSTDVKSYLEQLDNLCNHGAKTTRLALAFRALEVSRERQRTFGRSGA